MLFFIEPLVDVDEVEIFTPSLVELNDDIGWYLDEHERVKRFIA